MKSSDIEELSIKLNPRNLGEMIIKLSKTEKDSNLVITVQDKNVLDFVNKNIDDIKNHLKDVNVKINDVFVNVKQDDKNMFSDNLNQGFNKEQSFKQNKNSKYKHSNEIVDNLSINDTKDEDDNFNILI
jgi:flagellar hook-length control protein FliK